MAHAGVGGVDGTVLVWACGEMGHPHVGHVGVGIVLVGVGVDCGVCHRVDGGGTGACVSTTVLAPGRWPCMRSLLADGPIGMCPAAHRRFAVSVLVFVS